EIPLLVSTPAAIFASNHTALYRLDMASGQWSEIRSRLETANPGFLNLNSLAADGEHLAGLGGTYLYASLDGGVTWTRTLARPAGTSNYLIAIAIKGTALYAATGENVYVSGDNGATWRALLTFPSRVSAVKLAAGESGLWTEASGAFRLARWEDLQASTVPAWRQPAGRGFPANRRDIGGLLEQDGRLWIAAAGGALLSRNGGEDFTALAMPGAGDPGRIPAVMGLTGGVLFGTELLGLVAGTPQGTLRVTGGTFRNRSIPSMAVHAGKAFALIPGAGAFVATAPYQVWDFLPGTGNGAARGRFVSQAGRLYLILGFSLLIYDDEAGAFLRRSEVPFDGPPLCLAWHQGQLFAGTDGAGVFASPDSGRTWSRPGQAYSWNLDNYKVTSLASDGENLYATAPYSNSSTVYRFYPDSNSAWNIVADRLPDFSLKALDFLSIRGDSLLAACGQDMCYSVDQGKTWNNLAVLAGYSIGSITGVTVSGEFLAAMGTAGAGYSRDGGGTWKALPTLGGIISAVVPAEPGRFLIGTDGLSLWSYYPEGAPPESIRRQALPRQEPFRGAFRLVYRVGTMQHPFPAQSVLGRSVGAGVRAAGGLYITSAKESP
ncbi:MAG: hypothetical protein ABI036_08660, partial [Fibrobacteria bacterium]